MTNGIFNRFKSNFFVEKNIIKSCQSPRNGTCNVLYLCHEFVSYILVLVGHGRAAHSGHIDLKKPNNISCPAL